MTKKFAVVVAIGLVTATPSPPAGAVAIETVVGLPDISDDLPAVGLTCGLVSVTDVTADDSHQQIGVIFGDPLVATTKALALISMTCSIHVGDGNGNHLGAAVCRVTTSTTEQATVLQPELCTYSHPDLAPVWVCTEVNVDGQVHYWDPNTTGGLAGLDGVWSDSNVVACKLVSGETDSDPVQEFEKTWVDPALCLILASIPGDYLGLIRINEQGDVFVLDEPYWDCPPYDIIG